MNVIVSIFVLSSSLIALSSLPYVNLSSELINAKEKLEKLSTTQTPLPMQKRYIDECGKLTEYENVILKDADIDKNEAKLYLKKLRKLNGVYEEVLSTTRASTNQAIKENDYANFLLVVDANLPRFFQNSSFTQNAIIYYEKNKENQQSGIMQREVAYDKAKKETKRVEEEIAQAAETTVVPKQILPQVSNVAVVNSTTPTQLKYMKTAYLDPTLYAKRERNFTPWMSKKEYQSRFDNGYYKRQNTYPAYIEMDKNGNRRVLEIAFEPKFYWSCTSGRFYNKFKKIHLGYTLNGKGLLSLHKQKVDGVNIYTGVWLSKEQINRELLKLRDYGIYKN